MDVRVISWHNLPTQTCLDILGYTVTISGNMKIVTVSPDNWDKVDSWFLKHYNAKRRGILLEWQFPDRESYVEFILKWM